LAGRGARVGRWCKTVIAEVGMMAEEGTPVDTNKAGKLFKINEIEKRFVDRTIVDCE
jgi:hypothetical protein